MNTRESNISRSFVARAVEQPDGTWAAQWAFPGAPLAFKRRAGNIARYPRSNDALNVARNELVDALVNRAKIVGRQSGKPDRYKHMDGNEFAAALGELDLEEEYFAYLFGSRLDYVLAWQDGTKDVPHPARLLLEIFKRYPDTIDFCEEITSRVATERKSRKHRVADENYGGGINPDRLVTDTMDADR